MLRTRNASRAVALATLAAAAVALAAAPRAAADEPPSFTIEDPRIVESSGLQASARHPGVYWTHNDSDYPPEIYALDGETGQTLATVTLSGVPNRDVEAIHLGPDGALYVGDIGDNLGGTWPEVWIYRFPEPERLTATTVTPTVYTVRYADGPRDAEALLVHPHTGRVYLVSKNQDERGGLYAGPEELSADGVNTFERVADIPLWVTDGAFSPDGTRMALRGYFASEMYAWDAGIPRRIDERLRTPMQPQGESVTFTPDGRALMYGSEGEHSRVRPVELEGPLLPESAAGEPAPEAQERDAPDEPRAGDEPAEGDDGLPGLLGPLLLGAVVIMGLRSLVTRRDGSG